MPIRFPCTACGQLLGIATRKVGTEINCPTCGLGVIVPDEAQAKLLRQQARASKQSFPTPDTPPEISIPRESHEAFDGGLESFLTQLDPAAVASKSTATAPAFKATAPPAKPSVSPAISKPAVPGKSSNGTHAPPPRPPLAPTAKSTTAQSPPVAAAPPKMPPAAKPGADIPLAVALEESDVAVLSAADLLEIADEPVPAAAQPHANTAPPSAKAAPPLPKAAPPIAKPQVAAVVPPAPPKAPPLPPPPPAATVAVPSPASAPLLELSNPLAADAGFDFSSPAPAVATTSSARKKEPAAAPSASQPATIPTPPFENAVWISRRAIYTHVAILVLISIVTFLIGWISGGAGARLPLGTNAPVRFEAQIQYVAANGKTLPDEGAVVLLWPKQAKPLERLSSKRLSPAEPPPPADFPALKALETLRGAYARTNAQGEVRDLLLAEPGEYYVLVISRNLARPANEPPSDKAIPILGDLFGGEALTLLGTRQFTLKSYMIAETRLLSHTFGAPAEK